jgi:hypothetical protein
MVPIYEKAAVGVRAIFRPLIAQAVTSPTLRA